MGAWIETVEEICRWFGVPVAPFMGAWIETWLSLPFRIIFKVAPFMGAWIETGEIAEPAEKYKQLLPLWEQRLLKF